MSALLNRLPAGGWGFWLAWAVVFVGFPLGALAGQALAGPVDSPAEGFLAGAATGFVLGGLQWMVMRRRLTLSIRWVAATTIGLAAGLGLSVLMFGADNTGRAVTLRAGVTGAVLGALQAWVLRPFGWRAAAWALAVAAGWVLGWTITSAVGVDLEPRWSVFGSTGAWAFQALTALPLGWLIRRPQDHRATANAPRAAAP